MIIELHRLYMIDFKNLLDIQGFCKKKALRNLVSKYLNRADWYQQMRPHLINQIHLLA